ncbi:MAG: MFS transporter [Lysobacteraceae bacterium]|nr:MAG: MFS transporter [Xanthomonadaceae bacterium]
MSPPVTAPGRLARLRAALRDSPPLLWAFLYFFCLLSGYYVLRPVRDAMAASADVQAVFPPLLVEAFASRGLDLAGFVLQVLFTATFLIMLALQPVYGALVSRFPRRVFLPVIYLFFIVTLLLFRLVFDAGLPGRGMVFYLWIAVFNLFAVAVFWSFMADIFETREAHAYYGYIGAAGTLGAICGPVLTRALVERIGIADLMLVAAGFLVLCVVALLRLRRWAREREQARGQHDAEQPLGGEILGGLRLIAREPLLRWMAVLVVLGVGVGTLLYNEQLALVRRLFPDPREATAYFANIDLAVNALTLLTQVFVTRRVLLRYGIAPALIVPAALVFLGYAALAASPLPLLLAVAQVVVRSGEFALHKPARESVYTRVAREWRYKAGAAIDTVVYRGADLTFVWVHKLVSGLGSSAVFGLGMLVSLGLAASGYRVWREQRCLPVRASGPVPSG